MKSLDYVLCFRWLQNLVYSGELEKVGTQGKIERTSQRLRLSGKGRYLKNFLNVPDPLHECVLYCIFNIALFFQNTHRYTDVLTHSIGLLDF